MLYLDTSWCLKIKQSFCKTDTFLMPLKIILKNQKLYNEYAKSMDLFMQKGFLLEKEQMMAELVEKIFRESISYKDAVSKNLPLHVKPLKSEFAKGFLSAFLNPKNIIFYLSLFTTLVSVTTPLYMKSLYALWMCSLVLFWDIAVSLMVGNKKTKKRLSSYIFRTEKIAGVALLALLVLV